MKIHQNTRENTYLGDSRAPQNTSKLQFYLENAVPLLSDASNMRENYSTLLAIERLDPHFRYKTVVLQLSS